MPRPGGLTARRLNSIFHRISALRLILMRSDSELHFFLFYYLKNNRYSYAARYGKIRGMKCDLRIRRLSRQILAQNPSDDSAYPILKLENSIGL